MTSKTKKKDPKAKPLKDEKAPVLTEELEKAAKADALTQEADPKTPKKAADEDLTDPENLMEDDELEDEPVEEAKVESKVATRARQAWIDGKASSRREDPVKTYLREIGKVPLLTKEGEVELAKAMEIGTYAELSIAVIIGKEAAAKLKKSKNLSDIERTQSEDLAEKGIAAAELMISSGFEEKLGDELPQATEREELEISVVA